MTEPEPSRGAARRLAIIEHVKELTGDVAMTYRYFGVIDTPHTNSTGAPGSDAMAASASAFDFR